jgi:hypothetical protein
MYYKSALLACFYITAFLPVPNFLYRVLASPNYRFLASFNLANRENSIQSLVLQL